MRALNMGLPPGQEASIMLKRHVLHGFALATVLTLAWALAPGAQAGPVVYVTGSENEFGTLDLATGAFNQIATLALPAGDYIYGMGWGANGMLYGVDSDPNANLWQINPSNGNVTEIGAIGYSALDATSDSSGKLYVLSQDMNAIYYTLNPPSPTPSVVGPIGMSSGGLMAVTPNGQQLYTTTQSTYDLVSINPMTGAASVIGPTGFAIDNGLFVNGTLYGFDTSVDAVVTINTSTGAATQIATYSLPNGDVIYASALVPEPSSLALGLVGTIVVGSGLAWRRKWRASSQRNAEPDV
jgi:hypothetical protein